VTPADLTDPLLDATWKGFPPAAGALRRSVVGAQRWNVLGGDLPLPLAVVHRDALAHNLRWMQDLVARAGIDLAPHGKTTLSPQLFRAQLDAGAWGITVASVGQVGLAVESGARRVLIANQVLQAVDLAALAALRHAQTGAFCAFLAGFARAAGRHRGLAHTRRRAAARCAAGAGSGRRAYRLPLGQRRPDAGPGSTPQPRGAAGGHRMLRGLVGARRRRGRHRAGGPVAGAGAHAGGAGRVRGPFRGQRSAGHRRRLGGVRPGGAGAAPGAAPPRCARCCAPAATSRTTMAFTIAWVRW
jgi:hypothetical protein